jgi:hypothetical protein
MVYTGATINAVDIKLLPIGTKIKKLKNVNQADGSEIKGTFDIDEPTSINRGDRHCTFKAVAVAKLSKP